MVKRIDRVILRVTDELTGTPACYGVTELERLSDGTDRELQMREVDLSNLGPIVSQFNLGVVGENDALRAAKTELESQIAEVTFQRDRLIKEIGNRDGQIEAALTDLQQTKELLSAAQAEKATLEQNTNQQQATITSQSEQIGTLQAELTAMQLSFDNSNSELQAAKAKIAQLLTEIPYDPRVIDSHAFIERITKDELFTLYRAKDPIVQMVAKTLDEYRVNHWPIHMDDVKVTEPIRYLTLDTITAARAAELLRDASQDEAYKSEEASANSLTAELRGPLPE